MRVGAVVPYWLGRPAEEALEVVRVAEATGTAEVWIGEMLSYDAFVLAGAAAVAAPTVRLVVGPLPVTVRTPVGIAMGVAGLQTLAGPDRVGLALGASTAAVADGWHGRPWDRLPDRMSATIDVVRSVLAGERTDADGLVRSHGFRLGIPAQVPEIAVAAFGPRMRAVAAASGDRLVLNLVTPDAVAAMAGPGPTTVWVTAGIDPSPEAMAGLRRQLALYLAAPGYGEMFADAGFGDLVSMARDGTPVAELAGRMPDDLPLAVGAIGSPSDVLSALSRYEAAGAESVALVPMTWDDPAGRRLFAAVV